MNLTSQFDLLITSPKVGNKHSGFSYEEIVDSHFNQKSQSLEGKGFIEEPNVSA